MRWYRDLEIGEEMRDRGRWPDGLCNGVFPTLLMETNKGAERGWGVKIEHTLAFRKRNTISISP
jgi:hypothetical protein